MDAVRIRDLPDLLATESLGRALATLLRPGDCVLLDGPLGAGKTALARALLRAACVQPRMEVPSPSYTLVQLYQTPDALPIAHYDLWRLHGPDALAELGWDEARDGVVLVEWPDRLGALAPADALHVTLELLPGATIAVPTGGATDDPDGDRDADVDGDPPAPRRATLSGWSDRRLPA